MTTTDPAERPPEFMRPGTLNRAIADAYQRGRDDERERIRAAFRQAEWPYMDTASLAYIERILKDAQADR